MDQDETQVSSYLKTHPQFFEHHPELLAELYLPSPHGSGTVSLAERQQLAQRDKIRVLESKMSELLRHGEENDAIGEKVHRLSLGLLASQSFDILSQMIAHSLREDFAVPYVSLRLWASPKDSADAAHESFAEVAPALRDWATAQQQPYCGQAPDIDVTESMQAGAQPQSYAMIALRGEQVFGLLVLASDDAQRFYPSMGTLYLKRIGELISASLLRHIA